MIPIIIGIVAAAGIGGALNAAGRATNEDYQCELNSICNKIEYLCKKTKEDADTSMANFQYPPNHHACGNSKPLCFSECRGAKYYHALPVIISYTKS